MLMALLAIWNLLYDSSKHNLRLLRGDLKPLPRRKEGMSLQNLHLEEKSSVSRIIKKSSGSYSFRIEGFSGLTSKVGDSTESPEFSLCEHLWQLRLFPGGSLPEHKNHISYYIASKSPQTAKASYKLTICSQVYGGIDETFTSSGIRLFEAKGSQIDGM